MSDGDQFNSAILLPKYRSLINKKQGFLFEISQTVEENRQTRL